MESPLANGSRRRPLTVRTRPSAMRRRDIGIAAVAHMTAIPVSPMRSRTSPAMGTRSRVRNPVVRNAAKGPPDLSVRALRVRFGSMVRAHGARW